MRQVQMPALNPEKSLSPTELGYLIKKVLPYPDCTSPQKSLSPTELGYLIKKVLPYPDCTSPHKKSKSN